ncbi:MAG: PQQ-dependent sugar dehydrogenase [Hyphomonadaceae bacterium]
MPSRRCVPLLAALGALGACSGGGSDGGVSPPSPPANRAPAFTSAATVSVAENTSGPIYLATASDPDGDALTYSVAGGADAGLFSFDAASRQLSFATPPDFEAPADANGDNVYEISLGVSDGALSATLALQVTVSDAPDSFAVRRVATGLDQPIYLTALPDGSGRVVVVQRGGRIRVMTPSTGAFASQDFLDLSGQVATSGEYGLLTIAFSPDFATDRTFFLHMNNTSGTTEIRRYQTFAGTPDRADASTGDVILTQTQPASNHNGGMLAFSQNGLLLIGLGDGGGGGDPDGNAQNPNTLLGKLLRIDPDGDDFPADPNRDYAIPAGNAFPGGAGGLPEIYALGLRNPFRGSVDPSSGAVLIGDVGQAEVEEVDRIAAGAVGPINFGWNLREGTQPYNGGADSAAFTNPVAEYGHGSGPLEGNSITGGVVYRGPVTSLRGEYIFADFVSNNIWSAPLAQMPPGSTLASDNFTVRTQDFAPDAGTINSIVAFGTDASGNVYIVDIGGEIFAIEAES